MSQWESLHSSCKLTDAYVFVDVQTRHILQNNC